MVVLTNYNIITTDPSGLILTSSNNSVCGFASFSQVGFTPPVFMGSKLTLYNNLQVNGSSTFNNPLTIAYGPLIINTSTLNAPNCTYNFCDSNNNNFVSFITQPLTVSGVTTYYGTISFPKGLLPNSGLVVPIGISNNTLYQFISSRKYKTSIQPLDDKYSMENFKLLQPVSYQMKTGTERLIGFIAEDIHDLSLNELVVYKDDEPETLSYDSFIPFITKIVQEQQTQIESQQTQINNLITQIQVLNNALNISPH